MRFYQYWILVIAGVLVVITIFNISKMLILITKNKNTSYIKNDKDLSVNLRNLFLSIGLLSITSIIYIFLVFNEYN